jgi:hypothetical protein
MKIRIVRKTDQWNNEDFAAGSRVFTISDVTEGKEQVPYDIHFSDGDGRCWRPSNGMLELLWRLWGDDSKAWVGRRVELFQDASVKIGRDVVGGIRVRAMSHISKPMSPLITVARGTKKPYTVQPLTETTPTPPAIDNATLAEWIDQLTNAETVSALQRVWGDATTAGVTSHPAIVAAKDQRKGELA